jgi:hypothetical protein
MSENVQQKITDPNQVVFENSSYSKRKASRIPLSPLNPGMLQNQYNNILIFIILLLLYLKQYSFFRGYLHT